SVASPAAAATGLPDKVPTCIRKPSSPTLSRSKWAMISARPAIRRQRKAAADDLTERADVGNNAVIFLRAAISETEPGHYLVEDQQNAVLRCDFAQPFEEAGHRRDDALEGFEDDARQLIAMLAHHRSGSLYVVERGHQDFLAHTSGDSR